MLWRFTLSTICLALVITSSACIQPHKAPLSQGNLLRTEDIDRLELGMTREQVLFLIGQPILAQPFKKSRWDYVYVSRRGYQEPIRKNLTLIFKGDKLAKIQNNYEGEKPEDKTITEENEE